MARKLMCFFGFHKLAFNGFRSLRLNIYETQCVRCGITKVIGE
jgi:hypothetical protein